MLFVYYKYYIRDDSDMTAYCGAMLVLLVLLIPTAERRHSLHCASLQVLYVGPYWGELISLLLLVNQSILLALVPQRSCNG